jgi:hypothetical protein
MNVNIDKIAVEWGKNIPDYISFNLPSPKSFDADLEAGGWGWLDKQEIYIPDEKVFEAGFANILLCEWEIVQTYILEGGDSCYKKVILNYYKPLHPEYYEQKWNKFKETLCNTFESTQ